jgi:Ca2+-binding EF-hand superfamily protein
MHAFYHDVQAKWSRDNQTKVMTLFKQFDENGDGQISVDEFQKGCKQLGIPASEDDVKV